MIIVGRVYNKDIPREYILKIEIVMISLLSQPLNFVLVVGRSLQLGNYPLDSLTLHAV